MPERILLGMLTPSSNTVLEPVTSAMLAGLPDASAHFGRFRVTEISLRDEALNQFDNAPLLRAAELLADARVNVIAWNGTSTGWLGFDADEDLCRAITTATGIAACTSVLALNEALYNALENLLLLQVAASSCLVPYPIRRDPSSTNRNCKTGSLDTINGNRVPAAVCKAVGNIRRYNRRRAVAGGNCHCNYRHQADHNYCRSPHQSTRQ